FFGGENNAGTICRVTTNGALTTLISFAGTNGAYPAAPVVLGNDGAFYGTTSAGGMSNYGTVFRLTSAGNFKVLASFAGSNGQSPYGGLASGPDGAFYGTTANGGS